jgi:hypothetical protein
MRPEEPPPTPTSLSHEFEHLQRQFADARRIYPRAVDACRRRRACLSGLSGRSKRLKSIPYCSFNRAHLYRPVDIYPRGQSATSGTTSGSRYSHDSLGTDIEALRTGYVSVTPLSFAVELGDLSPASSPSSPRRSDRACTSPRERDHSRYLCGRFASEGRQRSSYELVAGSSVPRR